MLNLLYVALNTFYFLSLMTKDILLNELVMCYYLYKLCAMITILAIIESFCYKNALVDLSLSKVLII